MLTKNWTFIGILFFSYNDINECTTNHGASMRSKQDISLEDANPTLFSPSFFPETRIKHGIMTIKKEEPIDKDALSFYEHADTPKNHVYSAEGLVNVNYSSLMEISGSRSKIINSNACTTIFPNDLSSEQIKISEKTKNGVPDNEIVPIKNLTSRVQAAPHHNQPQFEDFEQMENIFNGETKACLISDRDENVLIANKTKRIKISANIKDIETKAENKNNVAGEKMTKRKCLEKLNGYCNLTFQKIFDTIQEIGIFENINHNITNSNFEIYNKNMIYDGLFRTSSEQEKHIFVIVCNLQKEFGNDLGLQISKVKNIFFEIIIACTGKPSWNLKFTPRNGEIAKDRIFLHKQAECNTIAKINFDINLIKLASENPSYKNMFIYFIIMQIDEFFNIVINDPFFDKTFPEIKIVSELYKKNIKIHTVESRQFYAGDFLIKQICVHIYELKNNFYLKDFENIGDTCTKKILEIRLLYILEFFKFLNIKKVYLLMYAMKSIDIYQSNITGDLAYFRDSNIFRQIFINSNADNIRILENLF